MLTTCPNCLHVFHNSLQQEQHGVVLQAQQQLSALPPPSSAPLHFAPPCCDASRAQQQPPPPPLLVSLRLPPTSIATTCTVAVSSTAACDQPVSQRVLAGMAGGGIVQNNQSSVILQQTTHTQDEKLVLPPCSPQPSPSAPLSFVLPPLQTRTSTLLPLQWTLSTPAQQWALPSPTAPSWLLGLQVPQTQVPQSDTDLVRIAATLRALRTSGWYYEGLSWQESAEALQSTAPGTFLVRDSSDPRFLFSLSVQTERGPTSVRLHYVCGQFRLDAEPRLAPLMPLFECVVRLVEYYIEATKGSAGADGADAETHAKGCLLRHKEQVWVDARGHMYSHILLTTPLYKKQEVPSLQHVARLAINRRLRKAAGPQQSCSRSGQSALVAACRLPLPTLLVDYLKEYPYCH